VERRTRNTWAEVDKCGLSMGFDARTARFLLGFGSAFALLWRRLGFGRGRGLKRFVAIFESYPSVNECISRSAEYIVLEVGNE
jgi:hypothetical protein